MTDLTAERREEKRGERGGCLANFAVSGYLEKEIVQLRRCPACTISDKLF